MKLTIILLLVAASQAAKVSNTRSKERKEEFDKEKRELDRNSGIDKRTPLLPTVSSTASPGVEYADTKETHSDQSPSQQIYATPQGAKISDVLAQGPPFQSAIANQLYSPVSVYQSRFPTTYEVSQPVPSQLAYAEHSIQPQSIQSIPKANLPVNYQPQVFQQYETSPISQQIPANYQQQLIQYNQQYNQDNQLQYVQEQPIQPQASYARQEIPVNYQANYQAEQVKAEPVQQAISQNIQQAYTPQQAYNTQGAVSYASFAQNQYDQLSQKVANQQSQPHYQSNQLIKYQLQHQPIQAYRVQPQVQVQPQRYQVQPQQYQVQPQQYQLQQQYESPQYQIQQQPYQQYQQQYQSESKGQFQPQIQQVQLQQYQPQYVKSKQSEKQLYYKQLQQPQVLQPQQTVIQQVQPQQVTQSKLAQQYTQAPTQNLGYAGQVALPTFPPVQYFGKFAHSIFGQQ